MVKKFRGKTVNGWKTVIGTEREFDIQVNELMDKYDFEDYQFGCCVLENQLILVASILLKDKEDYVEVINQ